MGHRGSCYDLCRRVFCLCSPTGLDFKMISCSMCLVTQSCLTLCDPMDCSAPGSSIHEIFQARILEWVVISTGDLSYLGIELTSLMFSALAGKFFPKWALILRNLDSVEERDSKIIEKDSKY